ncbi:hypothetical protein [Acidisoma sp. C75]
MISTPRDLIAGCLSPDPQIDAALAGDVAAAQEVAFAAMNEDRPMIMYVLVRVLGQGHPAVRAVVADVWAQDHRSFVAKLGRRLAWQILKANGAKPTGLPKRATLWRGGVGSLDRVRAGWSWTTDKRVAAFFVDYWRRRAGGKQPFLLRAEVPSSRIVHHTTERGEAEMVIFGAKSAVVDGTAEEWAIMASDYSKCSQPV